MISNFRPPKVIEDDVKLKKFLDDATDGVVYVSFGSVIKASLMGEDKRKAFFKCLWKAQAKSTLEMGDRAHG